MPHNRPICRFVRQPIATEKYRGQDNKTSEACTARIGRGVAAPCPLIGSAARWSPGDHYRVKQERKRCRPSTIPRTLRLSLKRGEIQLANRKLARVAIGGKMSELLDSSIAAEYWSGRVRRTNEGGTICAT